MCAAPLVRIKQAVVRLKQELVQMDIRVGVLEHSLLTARLKEMGEVAGTGGPMGAAGPDL